MWQFDTEVREVIQRTPQVKSFRFPIQNEEVDYQPGQFFFVTIKINGQDAVHHFSFSSSPTEKGYLEFTKRITTHEYSKALDVMKPGDWANLRGPVGFFVLPPGNQKLAFLSGGIGITPLRSMFKYIIDTQQTRDVVMIYGNVTPEEIVFREELDSFSRQNPGLRIEQVLSGPDLPASWKGKTGFINRDLVLKTIPDYKERKFFISGPPKMVTSLEEQLSTLDLLPEQIKRDSFTGYD